MENLAHGAEEQEEANTDGCGGGLSRRCERLKDRNLRKKKQELLRKAGGYDEEKCEKFSSKQGMNSRESQMG